MPRAVNKVAFKEAVTQTAESLGTTSTKEPPPLRLLSQSPAQEVPSVTRLFKATYEEYAIPSTWVTNSGSRA
jgi:hypothetical protein